MRDLLAALAGLLCTGIRVWKAAARLSEARSEPCHGPGLGVELRAAPFHTTSWVHPRLL